MSKAQQVRETLQDLDDLIDAHVDGKRIVLQLEAPGVIDRPTLEKLLAAEKVVIVEAKRDDSLRF